MQAVVEERVDQLLRARHGVGDGRRRLPGQSTGGAQPESSRRDVGDRAPDAERRGGRRRRGVQHVNHSLRLDEAEIVDEAGRSADGLGAHARATALRSSTQSGTSRCNAVTKARLLSERYISPKPVRQYFRPCARGRGYAAMSARSRSDTSVPVALALQRQHGVRPGLDAAVDHAREMHAQERENAGRAPG